MNYYMLSENEIKEILKKGKFDKEENAEKLICDCCINGDILNNYLENNTDIEFEKIKNLKNLYQAISDDIEPSESLISDIWEDLNRKLDKFIKEYGDKYIENL